MVATFFILLKPYHIKGVTEAGCDEAGRGCLAGPVFAAAVILPPKFRNYTLNDSKQMTEKNRYELRDVIQKKALAFAVARVEHEEIDKINILNASILAMHKAVSQLQIIPGALLIDGNRFKKYITPDGKKIMHHCIVKGDEKYLSIAAASVLAKTYRDDFMKKLHNEFPVYNWNSNKGYPTKEHRDEIMKTGVSPYHRKSFKLQITQYMLEFQ